MGLSPAMRRSDVSRDAPQEPCLVPWSTGLLPGLLRSDVSRSALHVVTRTLPSPRLTRVACMLLGVLLSGCHQAAQPDRPRVLWFGGDVHLGQQGGAALEDLHLDGPLVVNLEGPIADVARGSSSQALFNPPDTGARLRAAGVLAAGVENNHALDDGPAGVRRTRDALATAEIAPLGLTRSPVTMLQADLSAGVPLDLRARLAVERPVVVLFHVLAPPLYLPEPPLREAVDLALQHGAQAVLAHGSHALGAVERRGPAVIAWGLGNLAFDCDCTAEDEGLLVRLELDGDRVRRASVVPVRAGLHGAKARMPADASLSLSLLESLGSVLTHRSATRADW